MKAAVITYPGSNCDDDVIYALKKQGHEVKNIWHKESSSLAEYDLVVLSGGFSYGDYLRCGAIASVSPIMTPVKSFAEAGGLIMGICNGFQILCEARLLPGVLIRNQSQKFICTHMPLKVVETDSPWSNSFKMNEEISIPMAHGDGQYLVPEADQKNIIPVLKYINNLNGSFESIAGVCNTQKNIFGLMPHPERVTNPESDHGTRFWKSVENFL